MIFIKEICIRLKNRYIFIYFIHVLPYIYLYVINEYKTLSLTYRLTFKNSSIMIKNNLYRENLKNYVGLENLSF